jgi:hypothetical protein
MSARKQWDHEVLSPEASRQQSIVPGDIVRSYDFPGSRDDCYVEGVVTAINEDDDAQRVTIHVLRDVFSGKKEQVGNRLQVTARLGVSPGAGAPAVFLIAKRVRRGDQ